MRSLHLISNFFTYLVGWNAYAVANALLVEDQTASSASPPPREPRKLVPKSSKKTKSNSKSIKGGEIAYSKAAKMVKHDIIHRINTASNKHSKSRGVLAHNIFAAGDEYLGPYAGSEFNDAINTLYKPDSSSGTRKGIDWEHPQFFGFSTDSTASNTADFPGLKLDTSGCDGSDFDYPPGETEFPPTETQCTYKQGDYKDNTCLYRPYSGSYTNLRDDLLPTTFEAYAYGMLPTGFIVAFDKGSQVDKANPYITILDGQTNQRYGSLVANEDPFLCALNKGNWSARDLAAAGHARYLHSCNVECDDSSGSCDDPLPDPEGGHRWDYKNKKIEDATHKNEGPVVLKGTGQPVTYVGSEGNSWFDTFINQPCLTSDGNEADDTCRFIDMRQCAWVRDPDTASLYGNTDDVYDAWLKARKNFEQNMANDLTLTETLVFSPNPAADYVNFYQKFVDHYHDSKPNFYYKPSSGTGDGYGMFVENEFPIFMDKLTEPGPEKLVAPHQRYSRSPKAFGDDFLGVIVNLGKCSEQYGDDNELLCDIAPYSLQGDNRTINEIQNDPSKDSWTESTKTAGCWMSWQITNEMKRFVPTIGLAVLANQVSPGALKAWKDKKWYDAKNYVSAVDCCEVKTRTDDNKPMETFKHLINNNENFNIDGVKVVCD